MASPTTSNDIEESLNNDDSDYGSDLSPEEVVIVEQLLSGKHVDDNPIINEIEHHDARQNLRLPGIFGREERSPLFQAARAAEHVAEEISKSIKSREHYPDCEQPASNLPINLTDAEASSE
jgi:exonuclease V